MSILASIQAANLKITEDDVLGASTVPSDIYPAAIKMAYFDKSAGGAICVVFDCQLLVNGKVRNHKETIYISNKQGGFTYTNKDGEATPMPGFSTVDAICKVITGKSVTEVTTEMKTIKVWDFTQRAEVPQQKEVLMPLIGGKLRLGILEVTEDKSAKDASGAYVPTGATFDKNEVSKVFCEDGRTVVEKENNVTEAKFAEAWIAKFQGKKINKSKGAVSGAQAGGVAAKKAAASQGPLFS